MISVNGHSFRTLNEPIYVNGKVVKQVWANDTMYYPEGNFAKVKFSLNRAFMHSHNDVYHTHDELPDGFYGPCNSTFTIRAVGIALLSCPAGAFEFSKNGAVTVKDGQTSELSNYLHEIEHRHHSAPAPNLVSPDYGLENFLTMRAKWTGYMSVLDCKIKFIASPAPVCSPFQLPIQTPRAQDYTEDSIARRANLYENEDLSGNYRTLIASTRGHYRYIGTQGEYVPDQYITYKFEAQNTSFRGMAEFNNQVLSRGLHPSNEQNGAELSVNFQLVNYQPDATTMWIDLAFNKASIPFDVTKISWTRSDGKTEESLGTMYSRARYLMFVPATEILYAGSYADAPEEAITINDSDLEL